LAKVAVQCSAETFVVKIATFAKPETVLGINDLVAFDGDSLTDLKKSFQEAVEAYLETCAHMGKQPEKSYKGVFNVRINPELHRKLAIRAQQEHTTLNKLVERSLEESIGAV
jgi:predicted HicB family RNase H-like nuclease